MKLQYLGTAAAEGIPAIFCDCDVCRRSAEKGGRNIRTRSQAVIDSKILIDFPADTYHHSLINNIRLSGISTCIVTHSHSDHLYVKDIAMRKKNFAYPASDKPLVFYAHGATYRMIADFIKEWTDEERKRADCKEIKAFAPFVAEGYTITALSANHDPKTDPVIYIIQKDGKSMLYAHDTGYFPDETWEYLKKSAIRFDYISLDCTEPMTGIHINHMSLDSCKKAKQRLIREKMADEETVFCINHFSHNGKVTHDELVPIAEKDGFLVSYDGMTVEF